MFRLLRGLITLAVLSGLVYVAVYVPLGEQTLWQHIKAIAGSPESKKLVDGVKHKAGEVLDKSRSAKASGEKGVSPAARKRDAQKEMVRKARKNPPADGFSAKERDQLRQLIRERLEKKRLAEKR